MVEKCNMLTNPAKTIQARKQINRCGSYRSSESKFREKELGVRQNYRIRQNIRQKNTCIWCKLALSLLIYSIWDSAPYSLMFIVRKKKNNHNTFVLCGKYFQMKKSFSQLLISFVEHSTESNLLINLFQRTKAEIEILTSNLLWVALRGQVSNL